VAIRFYDAAVADPRVEEFPLYPLCISFFLRGRFVFWCLCEIRCLYARVHELDLNWLRKSLGVTRAGLPHTFQPKEK